MTHHHVDKEAFCDLLLGSNEPTIDPRSRTTPRPPGACRCEGGALSTAWYHLASDVLH